MVLTRVLVAIVAMIGLGHGLANVASAQEDQELGQLARVTIRIETPIEAVAEGTEIFYQGGKRLERSELNVRSSYCKIVIGAKQAQGLRGGATYKMASGPSKSLSDVSFVSRNPRTAAVREMSCTAPDDDPIGTIGISPQSAQAQFGSAIRIICDGQSASRYKVEDVKGTKNVVDEPQSGTKSKSSKASAKDQPQAR